MDNAKDIAVNKNKNKNNQTRRATMVPPSGQPANRDDVERGGVTNQSSSRTKDGGMVILAGAGVAVATTAVVTSGGCGGCGGGGCGGGGCGGGGCGGGGCGGGCGG
ncbi:hypothetical protein ACE6H2_014254 [Prunus campanulata]